MMSIAKVSLLACVLAAAGLAASSPGVAQAPSAGSAEAARAQILAESTAVRAEEMQRLGISALQPPLDARNPDAPNFANFDEAKANPFPKLPPLLVATDGRRITTAQDWWSIRRPQIAELLDREIYGRVPAGVPPVSWRVAETVQETVGGTPVVTKKLVGRVDNSAYPAVTVEILMNVTTPAGQRGRAVPVVMTLGSVNPPPRPAGAPGQAWPDYREQLLGKGWGYVVLDTASVQADNGAGLKRGVVGLVNRGGPRKLDDWGALKAWAWGASRGLDYLQNDPDVNPRAVGIFGHSRSGKAALVAMAYDPRFAIGFISSSGAGGANLYRRNFGEPVANLAAANEFHWFAPNFLKYAAVGHTADELPVDAHQLIAMAAPRPVFIGVGQLIMNPREAIPGDGWVDPRGMFMAASAASPAWTLLQAKGLQTTRWPTLGTFLGEGGIGFRQHDGGHTPAPNWPYFIEFASGHLRLKG